jgi:ribosomal protein L4
MKKSELKSYIREEIKSTLTVEDTQQDIKDTEELTVATQNLKNVELILASNLNTFSLLRAKQIILTPLAINEIKEIYCD